MKDFEYAAPTTLEDAVALLSRQEDQPRLLAGGTDIIVQLREGLKEAGVVLDIKKIPELGELSCDSSGLSLGAAVPCYRLYEDAEIVAGYGALTDAAHIIGGWQIQTRASIGGNLCNSSPAADGIPPLIVHDATCHITGPKGSRTVPVAEFCTGPGKNVLQPGELLVKLTLPAPGAKSGSAYLRFIPRNEMDIAVAGVGASVKLSADGKTIESGRIAAGAVAPTPKYCAEASEFLAGKPANEEIFAAAGELAKKVATPINDMRGTIEYRVHLVEVLTKRALAIAVERARG
ncbi:MAG TPA: xanthine dehydrogenase family protein subunit M [Planctomycetaceae bacterium]|nr:xanthine dehydrogenase family protein subunit M [Planctomycetaceae bacterium]